MDGKLKRDDWKGFNIAIICKVWPRQGKPVRDGEALQSSTVRGHCHPLTWNGQEREQLPETSKTCSYRKRHPLRAMVFERETQPLPIPACPSPAGVSHWLRLIRSQRQESPTDALLGSDSQGSDQGRKGWSVDLEAKGGCPTHIPLPCK